MPTHSPTRYLRSLCALVALLAAASADAADRPNVVLMMTDDQGYGDVGVHGNDTLRTPNLDRLAKQGVEMKYFYVSPNCSPTRASVMTGRYHYRTGVTEATRGRHFMHAEEITIAEVLSDAGYATGIFGKWHLGDNYPMRPTNQGFDEALVHKGGGIGQAGPPGNSYFDPILLHNNEKKKFDGYCDDIFTDAAIDFVEKNRDRPFFAYLATNLPHLPLQISDEYADPYREMGLHELNARVYGMISKIDENVGRFLARLEELGLEKETLVIFLSDNGPRHRRTKNDRIPGRYVAGLRGTKTSVYECGIRVPFFIRWPGELPSGRTVQRMGAHIDLFPTILAAAGVSPPEGVEIDGRNLLPLLRGENVDWPDRNLYFQWHNGEVPYRHVHFAVRSPRYKLIQPEQNPHGVMAPPTADERRRRLSSLELYDIRNDPTEIHDIAGRKPKVVERLLADYEEWFSDVTAKRQFGTPQRIYLGTPHDNPTRLSHFDRSGPGAEGQMGSWDVRVKREGTYRATLRFPKTSQAGRAHLHFRDVQAHKKVDEGATSVTFSSLTLPAAPGELEAYLKLGRAPRTVRFVDVERLQ